MRKVILSEGQIKKLIDKLVIVEQRIETKQLPSDIKNSETKNYNISNSFASGKYELSNTAEIDKAINAIKNDIKDYPLNQKFIVYIEGSESKVPNRGVGLKPGDLSKFRISQTLKYLQGKLPQNVTIQTKDMGAQGDEWVTNGNPADEKYTKWQYVILKLSGLGQKEEKKFETKEYCNAPKIESEGGYIPSSLNFTQVKNHTIGRGEGQAIISLKTYEMPDILLAEYNGVVYGHKGFSGNFKTEIERLLIGTALLNRFGADTNLPEYFYDTKFEQIESNDSRLIAGLSKERTDAWGLATSFYNVFGSIGHAPNEQYMNAFEIFDRNKNINRLIKALGPNFKWGYLTSEIGNSTQNFQLPKVNGLDTIKVTNVSPNGATLWNINISCK